MLFQLPRLFEVIQRFGRKYFFSIVHAYPGWKLSKLFEGGRFIMHGFGHRLFLRFSDRLPLKARILFMKQLATLMHAGVPLTVSLRMLGRHDKSGPLERLLAQVVSGVENGQSLAAALAKHKKSFGELSIHIIAVGEISGTLGDNLEHLAVSLKKRQALQRKVIGASIYPAFIVIATLVMAVVLTVFVFPKIVPVFLSLHYQLPWTTRFLIFLNVVVKNHGWAISVSAVILLISVIMLLRVEKVRYRLDRLILAVPMVGRAVRFYYTASISRTLALLLSSGVTVVRAFQIAHDTTSNLAYKKELLTIAESVSKGQTVAMNFYRQPLFFDLSVGKMIQVGEDTGKLPEIFAYLAGIYEEEVEEITKNLAGIVEPILLLFMGILVGFIAISIMTPIYGITQHLSQ